MVWYPIPERKDPIRPAQEVALAMESHGFEVIENWHEGDKVPDLGVFGGWNHSGTARRCAI